MPASGLGGTRSALVDEGTHSTGESATWFAGLERGDFGHAMALVPTAYQRFRASTALDAVVLEPFTEATWTNATGAVQPGQGPAGGSRGLDTEAVMRGVTGNQAALDRLQPILSPPNSQSGRTCRAEEVSTREPQPGPLPLEESG